MRVKLKRALSIPARLQQDGPLLSPATLSSWLPERARATAELAAWAPESLVNAPFPRAGEKVDLLNGWRVSGQPTVGEAYLQGRWYLRRSAEEAALAFEAHSERPTVLEVVLNGRVAEARPVAAGAWTDITIPLDSIPASTPFAVEIRLTDMPERFSEGLFKVRNRRFAAAA